MSESSLIASILIDEGAAYKAVALLDHLSLKLGLETGTLVRVVKSENTPDTFDVEVRGPTGWWTYTDGILVKAEATSIANALCRKHGLTFVHPAESGASVA